MFTLPIPGFVSVAGLTCRIALLVIIHAVTDDYAPEAPNTFSNLLILRIEVIGLPPEATNAVTDLVSVDIIVRYTAAEIFAAFSDFLPGCIKMVQAAPEVLAAFAKLVAIGIIMDDLPKETLSTVTLLFYETASNRVDTSIIFRFSVSVNGCAWAALCRRAKTFIRCLDFLGTIW